MEIDIISFGKIKDLIRDQTVKVNLENTDQIKIYLEQTYPGLANMKYSVALNKVLVHQNTRIEPYSTIAIMPPFSGG